jgi:hypothetical protein
LLKKHLTLIYYEEQYDNSNIVGKQRRRCADYETEKVSVVDFPVPVAVDTPDTHQEGHQHPIRAAG